MQASALSKMLPFILTLTLTVTLTLTPTPYPDPNPNPNQASALSKMSHQFHRGARAARRIQMWQQARK